MALDRPRPRGGKMAATTAKPAPKPYEDHAMEKAYDLVIRGGSVVDGTGSAPFEADVAVKDGAIAAVGRVTGSGAEEIDARGQIVTPGFVDIHTHYDGQATW